MSGFPAEGYRFLCELKVNNTREWFAANKKDYENFVKKPSEELAEELVDLVKEEFGTEFGVKIYRIHRDVRFSKDKTPYNPYVRMTLMPMGGKPGCDRPGLHFSVETDEVIAGCGMFGFEGEMLAKFRQVVDSYKGMELAAVLDGLKAQGGRMDEPELKRVPAGFDANHAREELLRRKGLALWFHESAMHEAGRAIAAKNVVALFCKAKPLYDWMQRFG